MKRFRILVVEDEKRILNFLHSRLTRCGYEVLVASNGIEALEMTRSEEPDLIVLDLILPRMNGTEVLQRIRCFSTVPVIIVSARSSVAERIAGLNLGADDYLCKPFNPDELIARIEAVRRRTGSGAKPLIPEVLRIGNMTVDFTRRTVKMGNEEIYLTRTEWLLLTELSVNASRFLTYEELLSRVWGPEYRDDVQLLRTWISRLRSKLENGRQPRLIRTIPRTGYIINLPAS